MKKVVPHNIEKDGKRICQKWFCNNLARITIINGKRYWLCDKHNEKAFKKWIKRLK